MLARTLHQQPTLWNEWKDSTASLWLILDEEAGAGPGAGPGPGPGAGESTAGSFAPCGPAC